jgi:hypothetical protein
MDDTSKKTSEYSREEFIELGKKYLERESKKKSSESFKKRYKQSLKLILQNKEFLNKIKEIRKRLEVPVDGFKILEDKFASEEDERNFKKWILSYKNDFKDIVNIINEYNVIKTNPTALLNYLTDEINCINDYFYLHYNKDSFIYACPTLEMFENYTYEKPFVGIFEYILFDKAMIPKSNLIMVKEREGFGEDNKSNYILIVISANTAKRDLIELWPEISEFQKTLPGNTKNKVRYKRNFDEDLEIINYDEETEKLARGKKGVKKIEIKTRRLYDSIDKLYYDNPLIDNIGLNDRKNLARRRTRKSRIKKLIKTKE